VTEAALLDVQALPALDRRRVAGRRQRLLLCTYPDGEGNDERRDQIRSLFVGGGSHAAHITKKTRS
jgi:hypothetical protein